MIMKVRHVEPTPNPDALKLIVEKPLLSGGSKSFTSKAGAANDLLAKPLFEIEGITSVFYMSDFVTVNKKYDVPWEELEPRVRQAVEAVGWPELDQNLPEVSGGLLGGGAGPRNDKAFDELTPAQRILVVDRVLEEEIRPGLAGDGGGLEIIGLESYTLQIHYEGACGSCPSSTAGTLSYIEGLLKEKVDSRLSVVPV